jgi:hypothetical protein
VWHWNSATPTYQKPDSTLLVYTHSDFDDDKTGYRRWLTKKQFICVYRIATIHLTRNVLGGAYQDLTATLLNITDNEVLPNANFCYRACQGQHRRYNVVLHSRGPRSPCVSVYRVYFSPPKITLPLASTRDRDGFPCRSGSDKCKSIHSPADHTKRRNDTATAKVDVCAI